MSGSSSTDSTRSPANTSRPRDVHRDGAAKAVRVSVGPEFGTVGPEWMQEGRAGGDQGQPVRTAARVRLRLRPARLRADAGADEGNASFGKLRILPVRMNPDLAMGDELLKKTGGGNLFMVFGEPDIDLTKQKDGKLVVEIRGVDVYDPTTGAVRSHSTDDIACWFIDTDYDGESFFVRHAYFCGGDEAVREAEKGATGRDRRGRMGEAVFDQEPAVRPADEGQDRGEGHQPLRRRGAEGVPGAVAVDSSGIA